MASECTQKVQCTVCGDHRHMAFASQRYIQQWQQGDRQRQMHIGMRY